MLYNSVLYITGADLPDLVILFSHHMRCAYFYLVKVEKKNIETQSLKPLKLNLHVNDILFAVPNAVRIVLELEYYLF